MSQEGLVPWVDVNNWSCTACGRCCLGYRVPLKMDEYVRVASRYGQEVVDLAVGRVYLKHGVDNRCIFQHPSQGRFICELQGIKPLACKLFPFRVHSQPIYKRGDRSEYRVRDRTLYVYLDPDCEGIVYGRPSERFLYEILPEVVAIGMGMRYKQRFTTSKYITWMPP